MSALDLLAHSLGVSDRTLRRAAARGTIRCSRSSARRIELPIQEVLYLERRWPTIHALVSELRTLPNVRLAVLFGSVARGEENERSDIDLFVRFAERSLDARHQLYTHLERAAAQEVQVVEAGDANALLLADVLRDGRVLADRDGDWPKLQARAPKIRAAAAAARAQLDKDVFAGLEELFAGAPL
jgi:predicted nucleotidyltransferase